MAELRRCWTSSRPVEQDIGQSVEIRQRFVDTGRLQPPAPGSSRKVRIRRPPDPRPMPPLRRRVLGSRTGSPVRDRLLRRWPGPSGRGARRSQGVIGSTSLRSFSSPRGQSRARSRARRISASPGPRRMLSPPRAACSAMRQGCSHSPRWYRKASTSSEARRCRFEDGPGFRARGLTVTRRLVLAPHREQARDVVLLRPLGTAAALDLVGVVAVVADLVEPDVPGGGPAFGGFDHGAAEDDDGGP